MSEQPERLAWIDNAKAVGMFLVVWGHTSGINHGSLAFIYAFHMPLFFFLAGCVLKEQHLTLSASDYLKRNLRSLIIPYVFFWTVSYLYWLVAAPLKEHYRPWTAPWVGLVYGTGETLDNNVVLWFFTCLFSTTCLFWCLWRIRRRFVAASITVALGAIGPAVYRVLGFRLPWNVELAMVAAGFYGLGFAWQRGWGSRLQRLAARLPRRLLLLCVLAAIVLVASRINDRIDMNALILGQPFAFYAGALAGILGVVLISQMLPQTRVASLISANAIAIFPLHIITFGLLTGLAKYGLGWDKSFKDSLPWSLAYTAYAIAACLVCAAVLRRYLPWALGVRGTRAPVATRRAHPATLVAWLKGPWAPIVPVASVKPLREASAGRMST